MIAKDLTKFSGPIIFKKFVKYLSLIIEAETIKKVKQK